MLLLDSGRRNTSFTNFPGRGSAKRREGEFCNWEPWTVNCELASRMWLLVHRLPSDPDIRPVWWPRCNSQMSILFLSYYCYCAASSFPRLAFWGLLAEIAPFIFPQLDDLIKRYYAAVISRRTYPGRGVKWRGSHFPIFKFLSMHDVYARSHVRDGGQERFQAMFATYSTKTYYCTLKIHLIHEQKRRIKRKKGRGRNSGRKLGCNIYWNENRSQVQLYLKGYSFGLRMDGSGKKIGHCLGSIYSRWIGEAEGEARVVALSRE